MAELPFNELPPPDSYCGRLLLRAKSEAEAIRDLNIGELNPFQTFLISEQSHEVPSISQRVFLKLLFRTWWVV